MLKTFKMSEGKEGSYKKVEKLAFSLTQTTVSLLMLRNNLSIKLFNLLNLVKQYN
ncbi:MAG: hypothetical protein OHK0038_21610 [Flammeovirgaceae bacterium]